MMRKSLLYFLIAVAVFVISFQALQNLGSEHIKIWDEARGACNAIEMMHNGDYLVVSFDGEPDRWNTKTSFFVWLKVLSYKVFGINEFAVRFPSTVFVWLTTFILLFFSVKYLKEGWSGVIAVLIIANTTGYMGYHVARNGEPDTMLVFFVLLYSLTWFVILEVYPKRRNVLFAIFAAALVLAVYTKNVAGLAPLAGIFVYSLLRYKQLYSILKDYRFYLAAVMSLLAIVTYFVLREHYDPNYVQTVYDREIYGMFFSYVEGEPKHPEFNFYISYLFNRGFVRFFYFLPMGVFAYFISNNPLRKRLLIFLFVTATVFLLGNSSAEGKNEWYIAPIYPFLSLIIGISFYDISKYIYNNIENKKIKIPLIAILSAILLFVIIDRGKSTYRRNMPDKKIYYFEKSGYYIDKYYNKYPDIKEYFFLTDMPLASHLPNLDQAKFYAKKFFYQDSVITNFINKPDSCMVGSYIIATEGKIIFEVNNLFNYEIIDYDAYSVLLKTTGLRESDAGADSLFKEYRDKNVAAFSMDHDKMKGYKWLKNNHISAYMLNNKTEKISKEKYKLPDGYTLDNLTDIYYNSKKKRAYAFFDNYKVYYSNADSIVSFHNMGTYVLPEEYTSANIDRILIDDDLRIVYIYFDDGRISTASHYDFIRFRSPRRHNFPLLKFVEEYYLYKTFEKRIVQQKFCE